jgi:hypothetical protein
VGGGVNLGLGLQSYSKGVLDNVERPFDENRFERVVADLLPIAPRAALEIIMGLPGDNPDSFRRTLDRAMGLGASVRVFRCLVLPNALMSRAPASFQMVYDPITLSMISCLGWSAEDIDGMAAELDAMARTIEGAWLHNDGRGWYFPSVSEMRERFPDEEGRTSRDGDVRLTEQPSPAPPIVVATTQASVPPTLRSTLAEGVDRATRGNWTLVEVHRQDDQLTLEVGTPSGALSIDAHPASSGRPSFRVLDGVAYSYRRGAAEMDGINLKYLERVIGHLRRVIAAALRPAGFQAEQVVLPVER